MQANDTIKYVADELLQRLDLLAQKLGTTVEQLWPVLVQYQYHKGVVELVSCAFYGLSGAILLRTSRWLWTRIRTESKKSDESEDPYIFGFLLCTILGTIFLLVGIFDVPDAYLMMTNPQYYALQDLMKMMQGK